ncbi:hypothetical protein SARC_04535 [Sphaeroforma arctica JP610]|uniref:Uncharacterized protein n=1 Tax=Sphaeroforma arctica JP610 TaxID=667725 RepID=A0A0L0G2B2_9EUKA|nr:hypothetical protein SARC_04535 [Sphaeroforma arctica JP610]KNC83210.1 hypothetical protein SARC_04535 [Sphaeroforma arctica JP610]|eukprot:XP_014157112.1 hypothetical protein SARC_04535 [Sphaeroforma arctica JP610]
MRYHTQALLMIVMVFAIDRSSAAPLALQNEALPYGDDVMTINMEMISPDAEISEVYDQEFEIELDLNINANGFMMYDF